MVIMAIVIGHSGPRPDWPEPLLNLWVQSFELWSSTDLIDLLVVAGLVKRGSQKFTCHSDSFLYQTSIYPTHTSTSMLWG